MPRITGTPRQKGLGAFAAGALQSARGQLEKGRQAKSAKDAAEQKRIADLQLLDEEYKRKAELQRDKPPTGGRTAEQSFADWRRATDPTGFNLESSYARNIYDTERAIRSAKNPEDVPVLNQKLSTLWDLNRRAADETMRKMVTRIKENAKKSGVVISDDAAWKQAVEFKKAGYTFSE